MARGQGWMLWKMWADGSWCPLPSQQHWSLPASGSEAGWGRRTTAAEGCLRTDSSWEDTGFIHKTGGDPSIWTESYILL